MILLLLLFAAPVTASRVRVQNCPPGCLCLDQVICRLNGSADMSRIPADLPSALVDLSITHSNLRNIYAGDFAPYKWLKRLVIEKTQLETIGQNTFHGLPDLRLLSIRNNPKLTEIGKLAFGGMRAKALSLYLSDNAVRRIHRLAFYDSRGFRNIDLEGNPVTSLVEGTFSGLYMADFLMLPSGISEVEPDAFGNLTRVHVLQVPGLNASLPPFAFRGLHRLKKIAITNSHIPEIHAQAFAGLQTVEQLHIRSCNISRLKRRSFSGMKNVGELFVESSRIRRLDKQMFSHVSADRMRFRANHIHCSCHNMWVLADEGLSLPDNFLRDNYCGSPESLADRALADVPSIYVQNCQGKASNSPSAAHSQLSSEVLQDYFYEEYDARSRAPIPGPSLLLPVFLVARLL